MKILHALVGYLTVAALPFHPFAFASPLAAIDYDGYVNATPDQSDSALMKRVPGDIIEEREISVPAEWVVAGIVAAAIASIFWIKTDDPKRSAFTQKTVTQSNLKYPSFNWVICDSSYIAAFNGVEATDWGYTHHELKISFGRTIGYDLFWARSGTFTNKGDGGSVNWAYKGNILETTENGGSVTFGTL